MGLVRHILMLLAVILPRKAKALTLRARFTSTQSEAVIGVRMFLLRLAVYSTQTAMR